MNFIKTLLFCFFIISLFGAFRTADKGNISLICEVNGAKPNDSLYLLQFDGVEFEERQVVGSTDGKTYTFILPKSKPAFYYVGTRDGKVKSVILGAEKKVVLQGSYRNMRRAAVVDGVNKLYNEGMAQSRRLRDKQIGLNREFRQAKNDKERKKIVQKMAEVDQEKRDLLNTTAEQSPYISEYLKLYTFYSFQNNQAKYRNDLEYFVNEYFAQANLKKELYEDLPLVYDAFRNYTIMLVKTGVLTNEEMEKAFTHNLNKAPKKKSTYRLALAGITMALKAQNNAALFIKYGKEYVELCKKAKKFTKGVQNLEKQIEIAKGFLPNAVAPDFTAQTPDGKEMSLSDFRGKVVLVDFWASWCGPCRKENPHVVELYHKYKDKGFDVLSVSLDKQKKRWVDAIEKDGLEWHHISDLKGWGNEAAKMYSVTSIPHTVLLDKEGRIIARKLRGPALTAKLKELFGE